MPKLEAAGFSSTRLLCVDLYCIMMVAGGGGAMFPAIYSDAYKKLFMMMIAYFVFFSRSMSQKSQLF